MFQDIVDFKVRLSSKDGLSSEIVDYLEHLITTNPAMARKAIVNLAKLPLKIYANQDIKPIKDAKVKLFELRVESKNDICRFFFVLERPNVIVLYGFTKKTQKTDKKDLNIGFTAFEEYQENKQSIPFNPEDFIQGFDNL